MRKYSQIRISSDPSSSSDKHHSLTGSFTMARAFQTTSPDVSREQARYRRLMQISSARSFDMNKESHRDSLSSITETNLSLKDDSDTNSMLLRPTTQQWPRKLEPLPGRFAPSYTDKDSALVRISPPSVQMNSRNTLSPDVLNTDDKHQSSHIKHKKTRRLHSVPSEDEEIEEQHEVHSQANTDIPPLLPAKENDSNNNSKPSEHSAWSPICLGAAQVAALAPVNLQNQTQPLVTVSPPNSGKETSENATAAAAAFASTIATATIHTTRPSVRRPKRLTPMVLESSLQEDT